MSDVLGLLGRGLLADLVSAFEARFGCCADPLVDAGSDEAAWTASQAAGAIARGLQLLEHARYPAALEVFRAAAGADADCDEARIGEACALDALGKPQEAGDCLVPLARRPSPDPAVVFALGYCRERAGQVEDALIAYAQAIRICPQLCNAHERLAAMHVMRGEFRHAIRRCEAIYQGDPQRTEIRHALAALCLLDGRSAEAVEHYEMALAMEPDNWAAEEDEVAALTEAGELAQAVVVLKQQAETQPGFADTYLRLGDLYARLERHEEAVDHYVRAIELHPDYLEAASKLGAELLRLGRLDQAAKWFGHGVEINDRLLAAYTGLGFAQSRAGHRTDAEASLRMAAGIEPNSTLMFGEVVRIRRQLALRRGTAPGHDDPAAGSPGPSPSASDRDWLAQAIERYQQMLASRSNHAPWHYELALLLGQAGQIDDAIAHYDQVLAINPAYAKAWTKRALIHQQQNKWDEAIEALERSISPGMGLIRLHYELALAFTLPTRFDITLEQLERTMDTVLPVADVGANIQLALETIGLADTVAA